MGKSIALTAALMLVVGLAVAADPKDIGYDAHADPFRQLDAAVAEAAAEDKLVLLVAGGEWCIWCHYLAAFLDNEKDIDTALHDVFVVAKVYTGSDNKNTEFFSQFPDAAGAPHFWVLSAKGDLLASQNTLPLEDGAKSYDRTAFLAFVERWRRHAGED